MWAGKAGERQNKCIKVFNAKCEYLYPNSEQQQPKKNKNEQAYWFRRKLPSHTILEKDFLAVSISYSSQVSWLKLNCYLKASHIKVGRTDIYLYIRKLSQQNISLVQGQILIFFWSYDWKELSVAIALRFVSGINRYDGSYVINLCSCSNDYISIKCIWKYFSFLKWWL